MHWSSSKLSNVYDITANSINNSMIFSIQMLAKKLIIPTCFQK